MDLGPSVWDPGSNRGGKVRGVRFRLLQLGQTFFALVCLQYRFILENDLRCAGIICLVTRY